MTPLSLSNIIRLSDLMSSTKVKFAGRPMHIYSAGNLKPKRKTGRIDYTA